MRRVSKILTLILVVVFLFGIFAGCDLIGKDVGKYRNATAFTVGKQNITVGKVLDTFNSYYSQYYYMIAYGGWALEDVFDLSVQSLYTQYMKVEAYTGNSANKVSPAPKNDGNFANAEFLTQDQLDYIVSYVKYLFFTSFDSSVLEKIEAKYDLKAEETKDTSRDFYEYDDLKGATKYADYYLNQNFTDEDMDEYVEKYFEEGTTLAAQKLTEEDLKELYLKTATKKVDELNARLDKDEEDDATEITVEEYQDYQKAVVSQYKTSVKNNYGADFDVFLKTQVEDMIVSAIVNLYNYQVYKNIEGDSQSETIKRLKENYETLVDAQKAKFAIEDSYEKFIESLSGSSFIYDVPEGREHDYVFVKNILIPFNSAQTAKLTSLKADIGTADDARYTNLRNKLAAEIVADDFNTEKDDDGKYGKLEAKPFVLDEEGNVVINPECPELYDYLQDGAVIGEDKDQVIHDLMARFNTDVAQHSSLYSYVVRVGDVPKSYKHQWVQEFVDATNDAMEKGGAGHYGIGVSDYGVHIVYVEGYVTPDEVNFEGANYLDTTTTEYRLFKNFFETRSQKLISEDIDKLIEQYKDQVKPSKIFAKFLKENGLVYDLIAKLSDED